MIHDLRSAGSAPLCEFLIVALTKDLVLIYHVMFSLAFAFQCFGSPMRLCHPIFQSQTRRFLTGLGLDNHNKADSCKTEL